MSLHDVLVFLHILGAFLIVAGSGAATAVGIAGGRTNRTRVIGMAAAVEVSVSRFVIIPGALMAIVFGSWLVSEAGYDFGAAWISAAYVLWLIAMGIGTGVLLPHARRVRDEAARLVSGGMEESDALRGEFESDRARYAGIAQVVILVLFLYLMVAKPGA